MSSAILPLLSTVPGTLGLLWRALRELPATLLHPLLVLDEVSDASVGLLLPVVAFSSVAGAALVQATSALPAAAQLQHLALSGALRHGTPILVLALLALGQPARIDREQRADRAKPGPVVVGSVLAGVSLWAIASVSLLVGSYGMSVVSLQLDLEHWGLGAGDALDALCLVVGAIKAALFGAVVALPAIFEGRYSDLEDPVERVRLSLGVTALLAGLIEIATALPYLLAPTWSV